MQHHYIALPLSTTISSSGVSSTRNGLSDKIISFFFFLTKLASDVVAADKKILHIFYHFNIFEGFLGNTKGGV